MKVGRTSQVNGQDHIIQSGNYSYSFIRVASTDEIKIQPSKDYHDLPITLIYIYVYVVLWLVPRDFRYRGGIKDVVFLKHKRVLQELGQ